MVEFGLKLEDNKVADWSVHYIDYEKLKAILKKCKQAQQRYNDLAAKQPLRAKEILKNYRAGLPSPLPTPHTSKDNLKAFEEKQKELSASTSTSPRASENKQKLAGIREESGGSGELDESKATEQTELMSTSKQSSDYGAASKADNNIPRSESSSSLIARALEKAASGVTDYFSKSYERQVRDCLKEIDKGRQEFDDALITSRDRVNAFYYAQLQELKDRLEVLKESVAQSLGQQVEHGHDADELERADSGGNGKGDYLETPLIRNRKSQPNRPTRALTALKHKVSERISGLTTKPQPPLQSRTDSAGVQAIEMVEEDEVVEKEDARKAREADSIQRALVDQYRTAKLLHNFAIMNYTGFVKIVKKFDKTLPEYKGRYKAAIQPVEICDEGKAVEALADHMERLYANWFCNRNVSEARAQMLPKKGDGLEMDWSQLRLGYRMGMCAVLGVWVCWDCVWGLMSSGKTTIGGRTAFPVFRACGGLLLWQWCWGCSVWVWTRYRINYIYLFDFNPHIVESPLTIFNEAVDNSLVFLLGMLLYYKAGAHDIPVSFPAGVFPFLMVVYTCFCLVFPLRTRLPMWQTIWEVVTSPMTEPTFFAGYVGDIFTSMVKVFQDILWTLFFVFSGDWTISEDFKASTRHRWSRTTLYTHFLIPLLTLLPLWFRFNQCLRRYTDTGKRFPHLANAFKYALSQTVTLFGAFHPLYLDLSRGTATEGPDLFQFFWWAVFVASSLYSFFWDVYMDWGLGRPKYAFLGPRLMYPRKSGYYVIMAIDFVLRFAWVLTLVPPESGASFALPQYMTAVSLMLELFRRTLWGFLRLENEHRSNASGFRRVDFVPLHFSTGHAHEYKREKEHRGFSVLVEVAVVTLLVLGACVISIVMAQHATQRFEDL